MSDPEKFAKVRNRTVSRHGLPHLTATAGQSGEEVRDKPVKR
jgi:hypothetical protein